MTNSTNKENLKEGEDQLTFLEKAAGAGALVVYIYSIYLGFCSGVVKGLFMMFVPVLAQVWLSIERWVCEPTGFSNLYTWMSAMVLALVAIAQKFKSARAGGKFACKLALIVWCLLTFWMFKSHDHGARSPYDVALAFQQATANLDAELAAYYATGALKEQIEECIVNMDKSSDAYNMAKELGRQIRSKNYRARGGGYPSAIVEVQYERSDDEWQPFSQEYLEHTENGWKVTGGMTAEVWPKLASTCRKSKK